MTAWAAQIICNSDLFESDPESLSYVVLHRIHFWFSEMCLPSRVTSKLHRVWMCFRWTGWTGTQKNVVLLSGERQKHQSKIQRGSRVTWLVYSKLQRLVEEVLGDKPSYKPVELCWRRDWNSVASCCSSLHARHNLAVSSSLWSQILKEGVNSFIK